MKLHSLLKLTMPNFRAALTLCDGPHSVCGVCFSLCLNKSTPYLSLCLSLNSFCDETSRTWASLGPETRYWVFWLGLSPSHVDSSPKQGFGWVWVPIWGKRFQNHQETPSFQVFRSHLASCSLLYPSNIWSGLCSFLMSMKQLKWYIILRLCAIFMVSNYSFNALKYLRS